jgi:biuret amidohydrolase
MVERSAPVEAAVGAAPAVAPTGAYVTGTEPYPWPYDGVLNPGRLALVVLGAQRWWSARTAGVAAALEAVRRLREAARTAGVRTIFVLHSGVSTGRQTLPAAATPDAEPVLTPWPGDLVLPAAGLDACYGGPFEPTLRAARIDHLLIAGLGLEGPVHSTMRGLNDRGYECLLVADACSADGPLTRAGAVSSVLMSGGIFGAVGATASVVAALCPPPDPEVLP